MHTLYSASFELAARSRPASLQATSRNIKILPVTRCSTKEYVARNYTKTEV